MRAFAYITAAVATIIGGIWLVPRTGAGVLAIMVGTMGLVWAIVSAREKQDDD